MKRQTVNVSLTTHDGQQYRVREADVQDAPLLIAHARVMLTEPQWNITELHEFGPSLDQEEAWVLSFRERLHSLLLIADFGTNGRRQIGGVVSFSTQSRARMHHRGRLGIGVQPPYRGIGVGEGLLRTIIDWATAEPEVERVELSVFGHNARAIHLYTKCGFVEEARLLRAYKLADGTYYDDVMMVKWVK